MLKRRFTELSVLEEQYLRQRSRVKWRLQGDRNTTYFHARATNNKRHNTIHTILHNGSISTDQRTKSAAFFDFYKSLMGSDSPPLPNLNWSALYQNQVPLPDSLACPIVEEEIRKVIKSWPSNKSPGPDGFTGEFFKFFVEELIPDLLLTLNSALLIGSLSPINNSHIILIPKLPNPSEPKDFRPISIVHSAQRLLSKILANRLLPHLPALVHHSQAGFIKGRLISESFLYAQHVIHHSTSQRIPLAVFKADIHKAFDIVGWKFLSKVLLAMKLPPLLVDWILSCVLRGSSQVVVNGLAGRSIILKRGVRQGDPLSPYLFILAMDFLSRWILQLQHSQTLILPYTHMLPCLLYADDALFFFKPCTGQAQILKLMFTLFHQISGLEVNPYKSELLFLNTNPAVSLVCSQILQCPKHTFPITYLGLPLSNKKLNKSDYTPLIERFRNRLNSWSSSLLSFVGRLVLVNSCLSALPVFFISVFKLPNWVIKEIDSIRRSYLWQGHNKQRKLVTVAWDKICSPKKIGGLGVLELHSFNLALLAKWLWKWYSLETSTWQNVVKSLSQHTTLLPYNSPLSATFNEILPIFQTVTTFKLNSGNSVLFWQQNWGMGMLKHAFPFIFSFSLDPNISVASFLENLTLPTNLFRPSFTSNAHAQAQLSILTHQLHNTTFLPSSHLQDQICYKLTTNYLTPSSFYNFIKTFPKIPSKLNHLWKLHLPPRVRTFCWLMLQNKVPTIDNLQKRGMILVNRCCLCLSDAESVTHTFTLCPFFLAVVNNTINLTNTFYCQPVQYHLDDLTSKNLTLRQKEILAFSCYFTWRERCSRTFSDRATQRR